MTREKSIDLALLLLRFFSAYIFIQVGGLKLFGWFGGMPPGVEMDALTALSGYLEVIGGPLFLLGLFTRPVAFILAGEMAVAYFVGHAIPLGHALAPLLNQGQPAVLLCFIFLFFAAYGAGRYSLDHWLKVRKEKSPAR